MQHRDCKFIVILERSLKDRSSPLQRAKSLHPNSLFTPRSPTIPTPTSLKLEAQQAQAQLKVVLRKASVPDPTPNRSAENLRKAGNPPVGIGGILLGKPGKPPVGKGGSLVGNPLVGNGGKFVGSPSVGKGGRLVGNGPVGKGGMPLGKPGGGPEGVGKGPVGMGGIPMGEETWRSMMGAARVLEVLGMRWKEMGRRWRMWSVLVGSIHPAAMRRMVVNFMMDDGVCMCERGRSVKVV